METYHLTPRRILNRVGFSLFFMALAVIGSQYLLEGVLLRIFPQLGDTDWFGWLVTFVSVVVIGFFVFYVIIRTVPDSEQSEVKRLRFHEFITVFFICMAAMYLSNYFGMLVNFLIGQIKGSPIINPLESVILESTNFIYLFLYGTIVAPIIEELIFRKYMLNKVRRFGELPAIILTGIAFGLFHMNLSQFFYAAVLGMIFAYITIRTNTIRYAILLHVMINFIGTTIAPLALRYNRVDVIFIIVTWVFTGIVVGITLFIINIKNIRFEEVKDRLPEFKKSIYVLNAGTILFILICSFMFVNIILRY